MKMLNRPDLSPGNTWFCLRRALYYQLSMSTISTSIIQNKRMLENEVGWLFHWNYFKTCFSNMILRKVETIQWFDFEMIPMKWFVPFTRYSKVFLTTSYPVNFPSKYTASTIKKNLSHTCQKLSSKIVSFCSKSKGHSDEADKGYGNATCISCRTYGNC